MSDVTAYDDSCAFCGESIRDTVFARGESFAAVYNAAPILPGHSLVIPINHVSRTLELSDDELARFIVFTRHVTELLMSTFDSPAFDWTIQDGEPAGQTIPHMHLHVIPRFAGDLPDPGDWYPRLELERQRESSRSLLDSQDRRGIRAEDQSVIVTRLRRDAAERGLLTDGL